jgi:protein-S-isoprenylcysteine O-methyltransferase Ste14
MIVLHLVYPSFSYWTFPLNLVGIVPLVLGALLNLAADREFKVHNTTVKPFEKSSALITAFPFSVSRHPMYLGMLLVLIGVAWLLGTVSCTIPVLAFAVVVARVFVPAEERMLAATFGDKWQSYRKQVHRWI